MKRLNITPGKWKTHKVSNTAVRVTTASNVFVFRLEGMDLRRDEDKSNARAIAALPALMAALEKCHNFMRELQTGGYCIDCDHEKDVTQAALTAAGYTFD